MFGQNAIPAYSATEASVHMLIRGDIWTIDGTR